VAKSRSKRKKRARSKGEAASGVPAKRRFAGRAVAAGAIALGIMAAGYLWWSSERAAREFLALAEQGRGAPVEVKALRSEGGGHVQPGQNYRYRRRFPTSGPHDPKPTEPGFYDLPQPPTQLVHALEHGNIVVYYDEPGTEAMAMLRDWVDLYEGPWSGIVATRMPGLGKKVVLTAWTRKLELKAFDAAVAAAFIDDYRGRGPEQRVR
jgi:hypothetical protein